MDRLVCSTGSESVQVDNALLHWQDDGLLVSESASTTRDAGAAELVLRNFKLNDWEAIMIGFLQSGSSHTLRVCVCVTVIMPVPLAVTTRVFLVGA